MPDSFQLTVNGKPATVTGDGNRSLLEVLREDLELTGTKYGCGEGACGACSVLVDGKRIFSCSTPVKEVLGKKIQTIEGLSADGDSLHPVQKAFLDEGAFQCGYCTTGMIMATVALLSRKAKPSDGEIAEGMNGNLCRCCSYVKIVAAVKRASELSSETAHAAAGREIMSISTDDLVRDEDFGQIIEPVGFDFASSKGLSRRTFVQILGAGLVIVVAAPTFGQQQRGGGGRGGRGGGGGRMSAPVPIDARIHIAPDGLITVLTGKVECGQGARAEITQAAAEELRVPADRIQLVMADTMQSPDDGGTYGSGTTPRTIPSVRRACAAAREILEKASKSAGKELTYGDLAGEQFKDSFKQMVPADDTLLPADQWKTMGQPTPRPNGRDIVTGKHHYPSDVIRPGMLYGKVLRPPAYNTKLTDVDLAPAKAIDGVVAVKDGSFVAVAAPSTFAAKRAIAALEGAAKWESSPHPPSKDLAAYLREHARDIPADPTKLDSGKSLRATYTAAYIRHAPLEPRAAVAEWDADGKLTVWTGTQNPFRVRDEVAQAMGIDASKVRVIVPDFGGGFGGKHTGETAVEAARIAKAAGKPVAVRWTRPEEFTWAYFRPAAVMDAAAALDSSSKLANWYFVNINSGPSGLETPYRAEKKTEKYVPSDPPLRHGSYRALASTANHFGREGFMDEVAAAANADPLEFRLAHIQDERLKAVLEDAAKRFDWTARRAKKADSVGVGIACGEEKGSFVAACAEVEVDRPTGTIRVRKITQTFECGAIVNPSNLHNQVAGGIIMALGGALREAMEFADGKIRNGTFFEYKVPRFKDIPQIDVHLLDRKDITSAGAGETPLIVTAPAIANAVFHATGVRLRDMPLQLPPA